MPQASQQAITYLQKDLEQKQDFIEKSLEDMGSMASNGDLNGVANAALLLSKCFHSMHQMVGAMSVVDKFNPDPDVNFDEEAA